VHTQAWTVNLQPAMRPASSRSPPVLR